jgi:hypothetical protein
MTSNFKPKTFLAVALHQHKPCIMPLIFDRRLISTRCWNLEAGSATDDLDEVGCKKSLAESDRLFPFG